MTIVEISECFPNRHKPVTGEFILRHAEALSSNCDVNMIVPLRIIPSRETFSGNIVQNLRNWKTNISLTRNYVNNNLKIIYFRYFSLPRPYFETSDSRFIEFFFYKKLKNLIAAMKPDAVCCHWLRPWAEIAGRIAAELNVPFIIDHHEDIPTLKFLFPERYMEFLRPMRLASQIIVHSRQNKIDLQKELPSLKNIEVVYLGQSMNVKSEEKNFNTNEPTLVCVSHLHEPRKNIDILIKACGIIKDRINYRVRIIGDGVLKEKYTDLAGKMNLSDRIVFEGEKSQIEIDNILDCSDLFILPSYPEAFGIAVIEAMAKGLPVITCRGNGAGEEIKALGYEIEMPDPDSPESLANAILNLHGDNLKMKALSNSGKKIVSEFFTWERNAGETYKVIEQATNKFKNGLVRN